MKLNIIDLNGSEVGELMADKSVFGVIPNLSVVRQAILAEMNNMRQGTHSSKNRALVNGGGKKPWKQKGRGVARAGTIRSPLWKGGGTVFGPKPHSYNHKISKKISRLARCSILSSKVEMGNFIVVNNFSIESNKTSDFVKILRSLELQNKKITILTSGGNENLDKASRNLKNVYIVNAENVSSYELVDCEIIIIDRKNFETLTTILSK